MRIRTGREITGQSEVSALASDGCAIFFGREGNRREARRNNLGRPHQIAAFSNFQCRNEKRVRAASLLNKQQLAKGRSLFRRASPGKQSVIHQLLPFVFCLFATLSTTEAITSNGPSRTGDDLFAKANSEFAAGDFKAAIKDYNGVVESGEWSANLFYDLGNAYFRDSDLGHAVLNYERALQLDPRHPEADANLRIARDQAHSFELTSSALEKYLNFTSAKSFTIAAAVLFWGTIILVLLRRRKTVWMIVGLILTACCVLITYQLENGTRGQAAAVVVANNAEARIATADSAKSVLALPAGSEVLILQERGDWSYAALPNDQRGWIATKAVEKVRL